MHQRFYKAGSDKAFSAVACPIDEAALRMLFTRMPTQNTHTTISLAIKLHQLPKKAMSLSSGMGCPNQAFMQQLQRMQLQKGMRRAGLPGFTLHRHSREPLSLKDSVVEDQLTTHALDIAPSSLSMHAPADSSSSAQPVSRVATADVADTKLEATGGGQSMTI